MKPLPADFLQVVRVGAATLFEFGAQLRDAAARVPQMPELWLSVRDCEGLGGRLTAAHEADWRDGFADLFVSSQDLGVLDELLAERGVGPVRLSRAQAENVSRLRAFLGDCCDRTFDVDPPAA